MKELLKEVEEYKKDIDYSNENWIDTLSEDTIQMLSIIYRDYIVDSETKEKLIEEEKAIIENEKEKNKDYNLNIIVSEFDSILSSCKSKDEILSLKSFCDTIKGKTRIGSFLYDDFVQKVNEREESFDKIEHSKEVGSKNKERAKLVTDKNGEVKTVGPYNIGARYINVDLNKNRELFRACLIMQASIS